jgi:HAD superfamily hydrolase (TIGR01509 family)
MPAVLFGSIGTLADTSELQRAAFNEAFAEHGLDWEWSREEYRELLTSSGGRQRIADYAGSRGEQVDAEAVHRTKSEIYQRKLEQTAVTARPGVAETIDQARQDGLKLALVTTTSRDNLRALGRALAPTIDFDRFDLLVDLEDVAQSKPAPDAYEFALERLGESPDGVVAIEDNVGGLQAARAAGLTCVAFPGENNAGHDFGEAARTVDHISLDGLRALVARG